MDRGDLNKVQPDQDDGLVSDSGTVPVTVVEGTDKPHPANAMPLVRFWMLCVGVCLGLFLSMIDTSIVATSLYNIGLEFHNLNDVNWVALAYTLAYMGCAVVFSRVSDIVGRRDAFVVAYVLFFAFSLACGWASSMRELIAFRAVQGVGGSGLYSLSMIMLPEMSPQHLRRHIGAMVGVVVAVSGVLGPVLGGVLTRYASWRWVFWINGPIGAVSLAIFLLSWPKKEHLPVLTKHSWKQIDCLGSFLTIAAAVLVVLAFQNTSGDGTRANDWSSPVFIAALTVGLTCWLALFAWQYLVERRFAARLIPAFPIRLFRHGIYAAGAINTLLLGLPYMLLIYTIPIRIQVVGAKSPLLAGVMLLPMLATMAVGSFVSGALNSRQKHFIIETIIVGSSLMLLGCGLLITLSTSELDMGKLLGFITFCGLGFGLTVSSSTMIASIDVSPRDYAPAQGILAQLRIFGGSLGIAASSAILRAQSPARQSASGDQATRLAYAEAFRKDMIVATAISGAAVVIISIAFWKGRRRGHAPAQQSHD